MRRRRTPGACRPHTLCIGLLLAAACVPVARGADETPATRSRGAPTEMIKLDVSSNLTLEAIVLQFSDLLGLNIIYTEKLDAPISLRMPNEIPRDALLGLLQSLLESRGLALQETDAPGTVRIVARKELPALSPWQSEPAGGPRIGAITRVFVLQHADAAAVVGGVREYLVGDHNLHAIPPRTLLVTDHAAGIERVERLIALLDVPGEKMTSRIVKLEHRAAEELVKLITPAITTTSTTTTPDRKPTAATGALHFLPDVSTNQIIVVGSVARVDWATQFIKSFDNAPDMQRRYYRPSTVAAGKLDEIIRQTLDPVLVKHGYRAAVSEESGTLVVSATPAVHDAIAELLTHLEAPLEAEAEPVRTYHLMNAVASEVLATLQALEGTGGLENVQVEGVNERDPYFGPDAAVSPTPAASGSTRTLPPPAPTAGESPAGAAARRGEPGATTRLATVAAHEQSNSIIVIAPPAVQRVYERLIKQLDQRRAQVLIEAFIVSLDTTHDRSIGVDIGTKTGNLIAISSFGLSEVNPITGALTPTASLGGNLALLEPDVADVVIKALMSDSRSRLVSAPRVLVNDHAAGNLNSVNAEPFQRTVVTDSATIIGEGSSAEAGTRITVVPHISRDEYLQIEYQVELSSFTGPRQANLPPPSQNNTIASTVMIPDGHTIVVGGLNRTDYRQGVSAVPLLGEIPLVKHLFRSESTNSVKSTLFIFIRPTIMRDDKFRDLKHFSATDLHEAQLPGNYPQSKPVLIEDP